MTKYSDPRGRSSIYSSMLEEDKVLADKALRNEYLYPLIMLGISAAVVLYLTLTSLESSEAMWYCLIYVIQIVFGIVGLWMCAHLWLGGVGPLGLAVLRLTSIYFTHDLVTIIVGMLGLSLLGWFIGIVVYVGLLAWLFDLEIKDAFTLAIITWLIKVAVGYALILLLL